MATRVPSLQFIAEMTGESLVTVEHCARVMTATQVPAPYSTSIGRGNRGAHVSAEWLASVFLSLVLADPKAAPSQVPAIGNLRKSQTLAVNWRPDATTNALTNALYPTGPKLETIFTMGTSALEEWLGATVFELLVSLTKRLATDWDSPIRKALQKRFSLTISLGRTLTAEMELSDHDDDDGTEWWTRVSYRSSETEPKDATMPITRQAVIEAKHIEMLASIYANTLKHEAAQTVQSLALDDTASTDASPTNENGALPGAPPTRNQDHGSAIREAHTPEPTCESEISQAPLSRDLGPPQKRHWKDPRHGRTIYSAAGPSG